MMITISHPSPYRISKFQTNDPNISSASESEHLETTKRKQNLQTKNIQVLIMNIYQNLKFGDIWRVWYGFSIMQCEYEAGLLFI